MTIWSGWQPRQTPNTRTKDTRCSDIGISHVPIRTTSNHHRDWCATITWPLERSGKVDRTSPISLSKSQSLHIRLCSTLWFLHKRDYRRWLSDVKKSIKEDDSINIPNHFTRFFSYVKFYRKVFLGEISATKPSEPTPTVTPTVSQQDIITAICYEAVPIDPFLIVQCILR